MHKKTIQIAAFIALLGATPFQTSCNITDSFKSFYPYNEKLIGFLTVASIPLGVWTYQRYQENKKPTMQVIDEALNTINITKSSPFLDNFNATFNVEDLREAIDGFVNAYYPGYRFPYLSYIKKAEENLEIVDSSLWKIEKRINKNNPEDATHYDALTAALRDLTSYSRKLTELITRVKNHPYYYSQNNERTTDEL